jgi:peptidoglycan/xylan/chitin deacetylase (PgdA/CDA1 family)
MQIGAHTVSHPILECSKDLQARWEISHSKRVLETCLRQPVELFAYPNGRPNQDYSARHVAMVREAGFLAAVSTASGVASPAADLLQLPRFTPWDRSRLRFGLRMLGNLRKRPGAAAV